jgi:hypothetical protein
MSSRPPKLVRGVDYYMDGDKFVFTEAYHLKRGFCCNSRCRHCPYGLAPGASSPPVRIVVELPRSIEPPDTGEPNGKK